MFMFETLKVKSKQIPEQKKPQNYTSLVHDLCWLNSNELGIWGNIFKQLFLQNLFSKIQLDLSAALRPSLSVPFYLFVLSFDVYGGFLSNLRE